MPQILKNSEEEIAKSFLREAGEVAKRALCDRALCGTVIVKDGVIIGMGYNAPPQELPSQKRCHRKAELSPNFKSDKTCCIHSEQRAVMDALKTNADKISGATLYFTRVDANGNLLKLGKPYCTICSKMALDAGIGHWVLWHESGITLYNAEEYNDISFAYDGE